VQLFPRLPDEVVAETAPSEPVTQAETPPRSVMLRARMRCLSKLNGRKTRRGKAPVRMLIRPTTPRPAVKSSKLKKNAKRAPDLYPVKRRKPAAKRATTRIIFPKRAKPTAVILKFQLRAPASVHRLKRAA
jgi:hypothetical protein